MMSARQLGHHGVVLSGIGALFLLGGAVVWLAPVVALLCVLAPYIRRGLRWLPWPLITGPLMVVVVGWLWFAGGDRQETLGIALLYLQGHRALTRRTFGDDRVSVLLSGLMIVAAASGTEAVGFLACITGWALALPAAMLPAWSSAWQPRLGAVAVVMCLGTAAGAILIFVATPRLVADGTLDNNGKSLTGFTDTVELGSLDELLDDSKEVFRVSMDADPAVPMYFRGVALEVFDGRRWERTGVVSDVDLNAPTSFPSDAHRISVWLQPSVDGVLFTAGRLLHLEIEELGLRRDRQGSWSVGRTEDVVRYTMVSAGVLGDAGRVADPEGSPSRWTRIPENLDPRIEAFARSIVGDERDPMERARLIGERLRSDYEYTRIPRDLGLSDPLATFLFERKSGHCEYFASAQAVLLRAVGVPSRLITGFVGGQLDPLTGQRVFRGHHAHAWVEVHLKDVGWVLVDATPGPQSALQTPEPSWSTRLKLLWRQTILPFDGDAQVSALLLAGRRVEGVLPLIARQAGRIPWLGLGMIVAVSALVGGILRLVVDRWLMRLSGARPRRRRGPVASQLDRAHAHLETQGWRIPRSLPHLEAARWVQKHTVEDAGALEDLARLYYGVRYGGDAIDGAIGPARDLADRVMRLGPPRASS